MIIEFVGIPGSGKTTCARRVSENLGLDYFRIHGWVDEHGRPLSRSQIVGQRVVSILHHPVLVLKGSSMALRHRDPSLIGLTLAAARRTHRLCRIARGVIDEGPTHSLAYTMSLEGEDSLEYVTRIRSSIGASDVLVVLTCDPTHAAERLSGRTDPFSTRYAADLRTGGGEVVAIYESVVSALAPPRVLRVDTTNRSMEAVVDEVTNGLKRILGGMQWP